MNSSAAPASRNAPRLSFAIPFAGGSHDQFRRAIASVCAQTITDWRLAIVDDTPDSQDARDVVASFGDPRISYVWKGPPHGIAHGWNACLASNRSELLTILHADDELEPTYAAEMLALAGRYPEAALYFCGTTVIDESGRSFFSPRDEFKRILQPAGEEFVLSGTSAIARLCVGDFINCPTLVYRDTTIAHRRFTQSYRFVLDLDFIMTTLLEGGTIVGTARRLYRYRRHASQQTALLSRQTQRLDEETAYYRTFAERLRGTPFAKASPSARAMVSTRLSGLADVVADARRGRFLASGAKLRRCLRF